jgi:hypothetical protein
MASGRLSKASRTANIVPHDGWAKIANRANRLNRMRIHCKVATAHSLVEHLIGDWAARGLERKVAGTQRSDIGAACERSGSTLPLGDRQLKPQAALRPKALAIKLSVVSGKLISISFVDLSAVSFEFDCIRYVFGHVVSGAVARPIHHGEYCLLGDSGVRAACRCPALPRQRVGQIRRRCRRTVPGRRFCKNGRGLCAGRDDERSLPSGL